MPESKGITLEEMEVKLGISTEDLELIAYGKPKDQRTE